MPKLLKELQALQGDMAEAAQKVYDDWEQDDGGEDEELGAGGICDQVADALSGVIGQGVEDAELFEGGQDGDDHAWVVVQRGDEAYGVDIPPGVYESGGGYNWKKKEGVIFEPGYIVIFPVPLQEDPSES
jgi:hypothetical protein